MANLTGDMIGILGVLYILLFVYAKVDETKHQIFKTFLLCFTLFLTMLVPRTMSVVEDTTFASDFVVYYTWFLRVFTIYIIGYFVWSIADYYKKTDWFRRYILDGFKNKGGR